jgi:CHASE2 domain-containing sensor protein
VKTRKAEFLKAVFIGLAIAAILIATKMFIESKTEFGYRLQLLTYEILLRRLSAFNAETRLPVLVLDVSRIPGGKGGQVTPRDSLREMINAISKYHPSAIGVDIDFSPNEQGWITENDPRFFDFCLGITRDQHVPIYLGIHRTGNGPPRAWLGLIQYRDLAVSIDIAQEGRTRSTTRIPQVIIIENGPTAEQLPTMSFALTRKYQLEHPAPKPPEFLRTVLEDPSDPKYVPLVNYSKLDQVKHETIAATRAGTVNDLKDFFTGKMVILGDATEAVDQFEPPGYGPTPGVYAHASAAYTFAVEPLFEFTNKTRIILDGAISVLVVVGVAWRRFGSRSGTDVNHGSTKWRARFLYCVVATIILSGVVLITWLHVVWLDFVLVLFALLLHPSAERWLGNLWKRRQRQEGSSSC